MPDTIEVKVPDIGDFKDIPVIEVLVKPGDSIKAEDPLISLESDKATMEVPSPAAGIVKELKLKVGDKVSEGTLVLTLEAQAAQPAARTQPAAEARPAATPPPAPPTALTATPPAAPRAAPAVASPTAALGPHDEASARGVHAGPSV
ncbi:MAG TPA: biotin/lipoyl-containing protein, partial [Burkholderiales bacterium]|nr:biotin/lipoyl-containing protein [Burkholderiales bacterium]